MTVLVGIEVTGGAYLLADSAVCDGEVLDELPPRAKLLDRPDKAFGAAVAGDWRAAQVYLHALSECDVSVSDDPDRWVVADLVPSLFAIGKEGGVLAPRDKRSERPALLVDMLIAVAGRVYHIDEVGASTRSAAGYCAHGCGATLALAALDALTDLPPRERAQRAMAIACRRSPFCRAPIHELYVPAVTG